MPKDFDSIMTGIAAKLNGDPKHDVPYLQEQIDIHRNDEYGQEIGRACGRLISKALPDDVRTAAFNTIERLIEGVRQAVEEAKYNIYKKDYSRAVDILNPVIRKFEETGWFDDDRVTEYKSFNSMIEYFIYVALHRNPDKEAKDMGPDICSMYTLLGSALFDLGRHEEAIEALGKARKFNPVSPTIAYETAMNYAKTDMEKYARYSRIGLKNSYTPESLARGLRNLGYYYSDKEIYDAAAACYIMSMQYDRDSTYAQGELFYIQQKSGKNIPDITEEQMNEMSEKYDFPMGPDGEVFAVLFGLGKKALEDKQYNIARELLNTAYRLLPAEQIKELLEQIPEENE